MAAVKFYLHGGRFGFFFGDLSKGEFHYEEIDVPPPPPPPPSAGQPPGHHFSFASTSLIGTVSLLSACALLLAVCLIFTYRLRNRTSENSSNFWLPEWLRRRQQRSGSSSTRGLEDEITRDQDQGDDFPMHINHIWYVRTAGLDRSLIDSIATFKFNKIQQDKAVDQDDDSGLIGGSGAITNCSVCLSEFQEGEELRLLPKCSHAFHRDCIDMWLSSHINCPLCRTPVIITAVDNTSAAAPIASPPPPPASSSSSSSLPSSSTSASADGAIVVDEKELMGARGKLKSIRRSASMDDCSSLTTTRGVIFRLQSGRQHKRPLRSKSSSYCGGQLWKEELNESTN